VLAALAAVGAMLAVRRTAPPGGLYGGARGIGVYAAVQGSLGILLAFVIFLAFQSYLGARGAAQDEATAVLQLFRTAELFPRPYRAQEEQRLVCYARAVAGPEWRAMGGGARQPTRGCRGRAHRGDLRGGGAVGPGVRAGGLDVAV
jgi:hypothetical protein